MSVFETLEFADLEELEAAARYAGFAWDMWPEYVAIAEPYTVEMAATELINLRGLWKLYRLWRYAGVEDEEKARAEALGDIVSSTREQLQRLANYLHEHWWDIPTPTMDALITETIRLLECCRGAYEEEGIEPGLYFGNRPDGTFGIIEIPEGTTQSQIPEPSTDAPDWNLPPDSQPPSGGPADPVPSEPDEGQPRGAAPTPDEPSEASKPGRRVARGPRTEGQGSGEGRGKVGPEEDENEDDDNGEEKPERGKGKKKGHN